MHEIFNAGKFLALRAGVLVSSGLYRGWYDIAIGGFILFIASCFMP